MWGMLLLTDVDDEKNFKNLERNFLPGGKYEFMKRPEDRAAGRRGLLGLPADARRPLGLRKTTDNGDDLWAPPIGDFRRAPLPALMTARALRRVRWAAASARSPASTRFALNR